MRAWFGFHRRALYGTLALAVTALLLGALIRPPLLEDIRFSRAVFDRNGELLRLAISRDEKYRVFTPVGEMSSVLREAVLLQEDRYFSAHPGINPFSMVRALSHNLFGSGSRLGGSTISMQVARLRFGLQTRSIFGKMLQIFRAVQLELHYSKEEILEAYVNLAPYGYNIEGVGAASLIYFHKQPSALTLPEALTLAVIPQSPARRRLGRPTDHAGQGAEPSLRGARMRLFDRWVERHPEDGIRRSLIALPIGAYRKIDIPSIAPHFTTRLLGASIRAPNERVDSTLDRELQRILERTISHFIRARSDDGIDNASALLLDWTSLEILASVGSADFNDPSIHGQVDGTRMRRSPGSTLKPFVYALAYDQGLIHPQSMLKDAPTSFGDFEPENFDRTFLGPISARDALRMSRNVPTLALATQLRRPRFYDFLSDAGIEHLRPESDYGLALVLGGVEVTMHELASLYALLARGGNVGPLTELRSASTSRDVPGPTPTKPLISPEASFLTLDALRDTVRPEIRVGGPEVFWKTGTSNGFRDAWSAGVFGRYVLVVWVGSFTGEARPAFVGIRSAAPLFFSAVHAIESVRAVTDEVDRRIPNLQLAKVKVCAASGDPYDAACPSATNSWFIPGVSPIARHQVFRKVLVNPDTGFQACKPIDGVTVWQTAEYWPTDLREAFERAGIRKPNPPRVDPDCDLATGTIGTPPTILSPLNTVLYHAQYTPQHHSSESNGVKNYREAEGSLSEPDGVPLRAVADGDATALFWFEGTSFLGRVTPSETLIWHPSPGHHTVRVVDDRGRAAVRPVAVLPDPRNLSNSRAYFPSSPPLGNGNAGATRDPE